MKEVSFLSDFNINESAEVFNEGEKKQHIVIRIIKWIGVGIILLICGLLLYRCITAKNHPIVEKILMDEKFVAEYEKNPESLKVHKYGMADAWESVDQGRILEFNELYHIPATKQLQFSIKYNHDIVKTDFTGIPFKLRLVDENGKIYENYWYETAKRERFRYIRVCFEDIELLTGKTVTEGENKGKAERHSYIVEIDMIQPGGKYETICRYEVYDGDTDRSDVFKNIEIDPGEVKKEKAIIDKKKTAK